MTTTRTFGEIVETYPGPVQKLAADARRLIRRLLPKAEETVDRSVGVVSYGYGPGYKGMVCTLILSKSGVKLGLVRGGELTDPHGLLEGSGKVHRYVQLSSPADLRRANLNQLIEAADAAWHKRSGNSKL